MYGVSPAVKVLVEEDRPVGTQLAVEVDTGHSGAVVGRFAVALAEAVEEAPRHI